jgi:hypothetical protein
MKYHVFRFLTVFTLVFVFTSCSLKKDNRSIRTTLNGSWQLTDIRYEGAQGRFSSVIFGDASDECFKGSEWFFRANNSNGTYAITKPDCATGQRNFIWSFVDGYAGSYALQIKPTDAKRNSTMNNAGYRLDVSQLDGSTMVLRSQLQVEGKPITLVYQFSKISF